MASALVVVVAALNLNVGEGVDGSRVDEFLVGLLLLDGRLVIIVKVVAHLLVRRCHHRNHLAMLLTVDVVLLDHG